ncbi:SpoIIE family protein phosphatase [Brevibacillus ruminantium]|uniref:SpoIIE family protein phosphatase n=1 Tax=Brevibacillus ruminantium TaxID=2950604 RepID=A0ABY4WJV3_9BACL|nr:SpoIIE family protein phosphatase [Brevibacillus ruminantium]USG66347.1 SpoIIE family protein phosphatase [Brevibacillus ruminantium]
MSQQSEEMYTRILRDYLNGKSEDQLYLAQQLGKWLLSRNISPEEVIDMHGNLLRQMGDVPTFVQDSFQILTEIMIEYGNAHRSFDSWRNRHQQLQAEIAVASAMQQSLLPSSLPECPGLNLGMISIASNQMSGDFYHFVYESEGVFSVAIADITGKGIPAAMCMSMLRYAMDSLAEMKLSPGDMLRHMNSVVERNIDPCMFVTMQYGHYDTGRHSFRYATAGHEPGFLYRAREDRFFDLEGQGTALGIAAGSEYEEREIFLEPGDFLILLTDGVTERKNGRYYIQREELVSYLQEGVRLSAQEMVDHFYRRLLLLSQFEQPDDYTMIVLRRT